MRPVTFDNDAGLKLHGILHEPVSRSGSTGVILLSPGVKSRVAPHRMYKKIADRLAQQGLPVLRFDFYGLGDSEGVLPDRRLADLYGAIQLGRYVGDTRRAVDWMRGSCGVDDVIVGGLCGGAITAVLAAAGLPQVRGIFGLGLPVVVDGSQVDQTQNMTIGQLEGIRKKYLRKVLQPASWARAMTLKTDFRLLWRSFRATAAERRAGRRQTPAMPSEAAVRGNTNPLFPEAFARVLAQGCPVLLLFSESDRLYDEFREKYLPAHGHVIARHAALVTVDVVPEANHVFTFAEWQQAMLTRVAEWVERNAPGDGNGARERAAHEWAETSAGYAG